MPAPFFWNHHPAHRRRAIGSVSDRNGNPRPVFPRERGKVRDGHAVDPRSTLVRLHALSRCGAVLRFEDFLDHGSLLRGSMLPSAMALGFASPSGVVGRSVHRGVDPLLIGSVLHRLRPPVSLFERASRPRLVFPTTMTSADFPPPDSGGISPGNCTLLHRTAAGFTSTGIPDFFGVLCPLDAPCRPSIRFLSISSRFSHSLTSPGRLPFPGWLQMVVSSFPCSGISTGDLNPVYNVPMLGAHKASLQAYDPPQVQAVMRIQPSTRSRNRALGQA